MTVVSPFDDAGQVPFCPSILRAQTTTAWRDEHMPAPSGATAGLSIVDDDVHTFTPTFIDPISAATLGSGTPMTFDIGPIGTVYTSETPATWQVVPDGVDATNNTPLSSSVSAVNVTRTLVDGNAEGTSSVVLRYEYRFDCSEIVVAETSNPANATSCTCATQTITWRLSGS